MTKPFKYQRKGVRKIDHFDGRALLADEMGLGKTFQGLLWAYRNRSKTFPILVVCPAALKWNWQREAALHVNLRSEILEGRSPPRRQRMTTSPIVIINYDILGPWMKWLSRLDPQLVILDECQYIMNRGAKRTKFVTRLCKSAPYTIGMSGTPLTNRPAELYSILNILRPDVFPSFFAFGWKYCNPEKRPWGWEYKGAVNLKHLHRKANRTCMIRRRKVDVLDQLPPKQRHVVTLELESRKEYHQVETDFIGWLRKTSKVKAKKARRAERLVQMGYLKRLAGVEKLKSVMDWVDTFLESTDQKLILFGIHKKVIRRLVERYKGLCVRVDGSVTGKKRQLAVDKFQRNKRTRLFISNLKAGGVGTTLTASSTVAFVEMGWTPGEHLQGEDRVHRIGQTRGSSMYYLIARNTIEELLCRVIQEKQKVLEATLDGEGSGEDLDIFDRLEQEMMSHG